MKRRFDLAMVLDAEAAHRVAFEDLMRMMAAQPHHNCRCVVPIHVDDPCDDMTIDGRDLSAFHEASQP